MDKSITQAAVDHFFDLLELENAAIQEQIRSVQADTSAEHWKEKLCAVAKENALSSRLAIMRILAAHTEELQSAALPGYTGDFEELTPDRAGSLTAGDNDRWIAYLTKIASYHEHGNPDALHTLILRAWFTQDEAGAGKQKKGLYKTRLTREEAIRLGHCLGFSLQEMQWFLIRVFDVDEGLRMNVSADVIQAWCFLTGAGMAHAETLLARYDRETADIPKEDNAKRSSGWTQNVSEGLLGHAEDWMRNPETMDDSFMGWMVSIAPGMDIPSRTAGRIYRNLAAFACDLISGEQIVPPEEEFMDCIQDVYEEPQDSGASLRLFFRGEKPDETLCKQAADRLLLENKIQSSSQQADNTKAWHIIMTKEDGKLTTAGGIVNKSRRRVMDLLLGLEQVQKGDMLYLLWFTANLIWQTGDGLRPDLLCTRLLDFMDTASYLLQEAGLPEFYPPHVLEQSMLLSIVGSSEENGDPSVLYETMLDSLTERRVRKEGSERHSAEQKLDIVRYYRSHPDLSLDACAQQFDVSPKSLSAWQKQFREKGLL